MTRKTVKFIRSSVDNLPNDKPVVYKLKTKSGQTIYVGSAKRGRVQERMQEHLDAGKIPGAKVQIEQMPSIQEAQKKEQNIISRTKPKYNDKGK
jgi:excinuclease UvrABC nuclease subunit